MSENKIIVEVHGCVVCGKLYNLLCVYNPDGELIDSSVTSPGGNSLQYEDRHLVACDIHASEEIEAAYERWLSRNNEESESEQEGD